MDRYPHLNFLLLAKLPLNLIWRLVGLSHRLSFDLCNELLWKVRCEAEFILMPVVSSYRRYWLQHTHHLYGQLFIDGEAVSSVVRPSQLYYSEGNNDDLYLLTMNKQLYKVRGTTFTLIAETVTKVIETGQSWLYLYYFKEHRHELYSINGNKFRLEPRLIDLQQLIILYGHELTYLVLSATGRLYLTRSFENQFNVIAELFPGRTIVRSELFGYLWPHYHLRIQLVDGSYEHWAMVLSDKGDRQSSTQISFAEPMAHSEEVRIIYERLTMGNNAKIEILTNGTGYFESEITGKNELRYSRICDVQNMYNAEDRRWMTYVIEGKRKANFASTSPIE